MCLLFVSLFISYVLFLVFFFFHDTATTEIYTYCHPLSLHDALPTSRPALGIPANAGIDLIGRRPDIVAARLRGEAAAKRIDVARADFYPNISLSALVGLQSLGLSNLFDAGSEYGNGGAAISLPVFEGGRLQGRYRGARADYDVAVATYNRTLVGALRDVADIVVSRVATERQLVGRREALKAAAEASKLAGLRYRAGLSNQIVQLTEIGRAHV